MTSDGDLMLLSAFVDGELDGDDLTRFRERLLKEPELRRELDAIRAADDLMKSYAGQIDEKPVPKEIQTLVRVGSGRSAIKLSAIAAAVFLVAVGSFFMVPQSPIDYAAVDNLVSGQRLDTGDDYIEVIASFRQHDGGICRELVTTAVHQIVCRQDGRWRTEVEVSRQEMPSNSYQPAGAGDISVIDAYIDEHKAGLTIEAGEERQLIEKNWQ